MGEAASAGASGAAGGGGGGSGGAAGGSSILSLGLGVYSSIMKGKGTQAADEMQADRADRAAEFGKMQAALTDTVMREQLNTTLGNINIIRAAGNNDPSSPTTQALLDNETRISDRQRDAKLLSINSQVAEDKAGANYLRQAGDFAVKQSYLDAGIKVASAAAKAAAGAG